MTLDNLEQLIAIVGRNAAGKSTLLQAISWMARCASAVSSPPFYEGNESRGVEVQVTLRDVVYEYSIQTAREFSYQQDPTVPRFKLSEVLKYRRVDSGDWKDIFTRTDEEVTIAGVEKQIRLGSAATIPSITSLLPQSSAEVLLTPLLKFFTGVRYYPLDEPTVPPTDSAYSVYDEAYQLWANQYTISDDPGNDVRSRIVHLRKTDDNRLQELEAILGKNGLGVIKGIVCSPGPTKNELTSPFPPFHWAFFTGPHGKPLAYDHLSQGTRRVVQIVLSMLFDKSSVMLIEHPEDGIHRGLLIKLVGHIRRSAGSAQILMSSHSAVVMDSLAPSQIRLVEMDDFGHSHVRQLSDIEIDAAQEFLERDGNLSDFIDSIE